MEMPVFSVTEFNSVARELLESGLAKVWVEGEISNLAKPSSGHLYFSLKDSGASVSCALFKGSRFRVKVPWGEIENGLLVRVSGKASLYAPRGQFQLIVDSMEAAGQGALEQAFQERLARLQAEGIFSAERKRVIPQRALTIGVITSPTGAAIRDVLSTLKRRNPALKIIIYPCLVQGVQAPAEILHALEMANRRAECEVLLVVRGGGSLEDLWAFNDEAVARAVANSDIPIVSGVGHETDVTLTDFAADYRAPTPTAAAETVSPVLAEILLQLSQRSIATQTQFQSFIRRSSQQLLAFERRLALQSPLRQWQVHVQRLDECQLRLVKALQSKLQYAQIHVQGLEKRWQLQSPKRQLLAKHQQLEALQRQLNKAFFAKQKYAQERLLSNTQRFSAFSLEKKHLVAQTAFEQQSKRLSMVMKRLIIAQRKNISDLAGRFMLLNPLAILSRGYALALDENDKVIKQSTEVELRSEITVCLAKGSLRCEVIEQQS
ncbi:exodeoxyribonuclease VII large subunit [Suttonella ornithocola]|uniref:Exodeoxyribonuclease 7 large subunit n=1 Tax=Suttonella ornithocola TaxID=279832 RepID=A0A380MM48_9GAMM|nr:exodeoxyribonuclease VII large subunit [Suttonella ornithocola]SUO93680.1 Exodeoxyribonuclease 7 large subunit [Suttonella ornithocola]